jgi:isopentenyl-diphosphate delta-isomerase
MEEVILVDQDDREVGVAEKLQVHRDGSLHRAFSIFVFNSQGQLLVQQRAMDKYHSGGLWTNTGDGHPRPGETVEAASRRRLKEEMGFECDLELLFRFTYQVELENGLFEHEVDYVLVGQFDGDPSPDPAEVGDWEWAEVVTLRRDVQQNPDRYAYWFRAPLDRVLAAVRAREG